MKLIKSTSVPASYCDSDVKLSVVGAFQIVEDLVTEMMGDLHIDGLVCMKEYGAMWLFVRNRIEMPRPLKWKEEYSSECYISSVGKGRMNIDTVLKNMDKEIAAVSRLELCAIDLQTFRLRKMDTVGFDGSITAEVPEYDITFRRGKFTPSTLLDTVTVRSSDIDYCHHTNNISYIRFLMNQWSVDELSTRPVRAIEVQYAGQTHEGDILQIYSSEKNRDDDAGEGFVICHNDAVILNCLVCR